MFGGILDAAASATTAARRWGGTCRCWRATARRSCRPSCWPALALRRAASPCRSTGRSNGGGRRPSDEPAYRLAVTGCTRPPSPTSSGRLSATRSPTVRAVRQAAFDAVGAGHLHRLQVNRLVVAEVGDERVRAAHDQSGHRDRRIAGDWHVQRHVGEAAGHQEVVAVVDVQFDEQRAGARIELVRGAGNPRLARDARRWHRRSRRPRRRHARTARRAVPHSTSTRSLLWSAIVIDRLVAGLVGGRVLHQRADIDEARGHHAVERGADCSYDFIAWQLRDGGRRHACSRSPPDRPADRGPAMAHQVCAPFGSCVACSQVATRRPRIADRSRPRQPLPAITWPPSRGRRDRPRSIVT